MGYALTIGLAVLLLIGLPIGLALALGSMIGLEFFSAVPLQIAAQRMIAGIRNFPLLAIPLFIFAGALMNAAGITERLVGFARALIGGARGGLALVTIVTTAIFGGISGSQVADTSSVGKLMVPQMINRGYSRGYASAVQASAGALFITIPPSITLIIYGVLAQTSISDLFAWGLIIGLVFVGAMMLVAWVIAVIQKQPAEPRLPARDMGKAFVRGIWSLLIPVVVLGGIRIGAFTPTEAGAIAVFCALFIGVVIHRQLTFRSILRALAESSILVGVIMVVVAAAQLYAWALVTGQIPQQLTGMMSGLIQNPYLFLLVVNVILLLIGTVMETNALLIIFVPILLPVALAAGIDPLHLGLIMVVNLGIGLMTPPVGLCLLVASKLGDVPMNKVIPATLPWIGVALMLLAAITYLPLLLGWV